MGTGSRENGTDLTRDYLFPVMISTLLQYKEAPREPSSCVERAAREWPRAGSWTHLAFPARKREKLPGHCFLLKQTLPDAAGSILRWRNKMPGDTSALLTRMKRQGWRSEWSKTNPNARDETFEREQDIET